MAQAYVNGHAAYERAGHPAADICINGLVVGTPQEWEGLLAQQRQAPPDMSPDRKAVRYRVEAYDVHVVNSDYRFAAPPRLLEKHSPTDGVRMMLALSASGTVYFGAGKTDDDYLLKQHFQDSFILVPNWDLLEKPGVRHGRRYLIISHNYRAY